MIVVSTICRGAPLHEPSGRVHILDPDSGACALQFVLPETPYRVGDPNPRGGTRGARGIAVGDGVVFVANYDTIYRFDVLWRVAGTISHPDCADIHDIALRDGTLWVASTRNDLLFAFDLDGRLVERIDPWEHAALDGHFRINPASQPFDADIRDPYAHEKSPTDRLHLNSFAFTDDGALTLSLGQFRVDGHAESALVRIDGGVTTVLYRNENASMPSHNVLYLPDGAILHADTSNGRVVRITPPERGNAEQERGGRGSRRAEGAVEDYLFTLNDRSRTTETILQTPRFTRGLCRLADGRVAVGVQNEVWLTKPESKVPAQRIQLSDDPRVSVHSIAVLRESPVHTADSWSHATS